MIETIHWHTLHPRYLGPLSRVLDLGANYGHFADAITKRFGCHCVAVEPSPAPFAAIPETGCVSKLQAAITDKSGTVPFRLDVDSVASSLACTSGNETIDVPALSLPDLLDRLEWKRVDLLKVDIEGAEIAVLAACDDSVLGRIAQISIEFHDFCGITPRSDVLETLERLDRNGFFSVRMSRVGHQDTWLINQRLLPISATELAFTKYYLRNWRGLKRVARKRLSGGSG